MTKKSLNKLLSVILTLAICSAAVFGCLITANAADVTCYEWSEGVTSKDLTSATIDLTLTAPSSVLPDGMAAAQLGFTADEGLVLNSVAVKGGVPTSGAFDAADFEALEKGADGKYLIDVKTADKYYTSVVLTLTYGFTGGKATAGAKYNVRVAANSLTMFDAFDNEFNYTGTGTAGVIKTGCDHIFDVTGLTPVTTNTVEGYRVYTNVKCKNCDFVNKYQVVPATELKSVIYWDGSTKTEPTVQDADGNYIISTAAELAWIVSQTAESATSGKSYKVADGIDAIVLQPESDKAKAIMDLADYAQTKAYFDAFGSKVKWVTTHDNCFAGNFDGNGVEIYGLYGNAANGSKGVFGKIKPGITLKNFAVKNSYILNGDHKVGAVFGAPSSTINDAFITVEKVIVSGCYISSNLPKSNGNVWNVGVMAGTSIGAGYGVVIKNCLVYNNIAVNTADATVNYGLVGKLSDTQRNRVQNSIILDCVPYSLADDQANPTMPVVFENVYTNAIDYELSKTWPAAVVKGNASWASYADKIISINRSDVFGSKVTTACPALFTAGSPWQADLSGGYPTFDNTVATVATDIAVYGGGAGVAPTLLDESSENSESNPYIIATAENLLYIVKEGAASSAGKYYKVADNVKAFVLQPKDRFTAKGATVEDLMNLDAAGVMEWFDDPNKTVSVTSENKFGNDFKANWTINGTSVKWQNWNKYGDAAHAFQGTFDGNGVTVYGLVSQGGVVGLFGRLKGATIKNVNVKGSYGIGYEGGMLGSTGWYSTWTDDLNAGLLSNRIENCTVTNSVIISCRVPGSTSNTAAGGDSYTSTGLLCGNFANGDLAVNNCLVSGNIGYNFIYDRGDGKTEAETLGATITDTYNYANGNTLSMIGSFRNNAASVVSNCISIGQYAHVSPKHNWDNNGGRFASFSNCYTDKPTTAANGLAFANNSTISYSAEQIKQIGVASFEGSAAVTAMPNLDWNVWSYDGNGGYPTPVPKGKIDTTSQFILNLKAANIAYNTDGTFNFNFYYEPTVTGVTPVLYVGQADGSGFNKLTGTALTAEEIAATKAYQDAGLAAGTLRYTIGNISAREIGDTLLPTAVAKIGATTYFGKTEQISVADYAKSLIESADEDVTDGDKQVAAALINYGTAAATALTTAAPSATATDIVVYGGGAGVAPKLLDESSENSESNPYIIATAENLLYIVKEGAASSAGKYYKVADNVKAFVLQPKDRFTAKGATVEDLMNLDAAGVMEWFDDPNKTVSVTSENKFGNDFKANWTINGTSVKWQNWNKYGDAAHAFQGTFDGNGVTVYGLVSQGGVVGLFGRLKGATIKNVNVKGSYGIGYEGGMLGSTGWYSTWTDDLNAGLLSNRIENCTVTNSVIISCRVPGSTSNTAAGGDSYTSTGLLCGNFANGDLAVNNCLVSGNIGYNFIYDRGDGKTEAETLGATITDTYNYANGNTLSMIGSFRNNAASVVSNCISIGQYAHVSPKHNWDNNGGRPASFSNVYTDKPTTAANGLAFANNSTISYSPAQIKQIGVASFEGNAAVTAMPGLDWTNGWIIGSGNNYPSPVQTGATLNRAGKTIYWDGTTDSTLADNGETGTAEDPIIIDSAEELAGLVNTAKANNTAGKYFKLADNIGTIVLQPAGNEAILGLADAAAVKAHFESGASFKEWIQTSWEGTSFCGTFDGNGVEIYGMYQKTASREQGLFPEVEGGAVLKNFALKNSYVTTTSLNYATAFISARSNNSGYGAKVDGIITFDHIALVNNYMRRDVDNFARVGLFTGEMNSDTALVKNCLVAGNDAKYTKDSEEYDVALLASCKTDMTYTDDMTEMFKNGNFVCYTVKDSIFLGSPAYNIKINGWRNSSPFCYSNVYSDTMPTLTIGSVQTFTDAQIKLVNAADLVGSGAQDVVTALNDANGSTVWYTGNEFDGYPSLEPAGTLPSSYQSAYEAVEFTSYNSYTGSNDQFGLYTTSLNLKNNPYMSLVFAFGKEGETDYKANRANISVTVTGASGTIYSGNVPAYVEGEFISGVNGWTNKKNAGRYHTLKLNAPISDLAGELTVTINYNNGEKVITNKVSVSGFGNELINSYKKNPSDYYLNCAEAVKALLFYTQSVQKVYGSK